MLDMEFPQSVNLEVVSGTIVIVAELVYVVEPAVSSTVAVAVESITRWVVTRVRRSLERPLVSLHNVEFRAVVATDLVAITVVVTISVPVLA